MERKLYVGSGLWIVCSVHISARTHSPIHASHAEHNFILLNLVFIGRIFNFACRSCRCCVQCTVYTLSFCCHTISSSLLLRFFFLLSLRPILYSPRPHFASLNDVPCFTRSIGHYQTVRYMQVHASNVVLILNANAVHDT